MLRSVSQSILILACFVLGACTTTTEGFKKPKANFDKAAKTYLKLGISYINKERFDLAEPKLKRSISIHPTPEAFNALALVYEETHNNSLAEQVYEELISRYPNYQLGYENYNIFLCKYDRTERIISLSKQLEKSDRPDIAYIVAGNCAYQKGRINSAIDQFEYALSFNNKNEQALLPLAKIYYDKQQYQEAYHFIRLVNNFVGYSPESLYLGILIAREIGAVSDEQKFYKALIRLYPESEEAKSI